MRHAQDGALEIRMPSWAGGRGEAFWIRRTPPVLLAFRINDQPCPAYPAF